MAVVASEPVIADLRANRVVQGDCIELMQRLSSGSVDLVFADPPFNIGYEYDVYDDRRSCDEYQKWSRKWMSEVRRILKPSGSFWLAIGDEYAAELKVLATRELGFRCRNWVIWYYTFGVHCHGKFTRSHAHLLYFVVEPRNAIFNDDAIRVPSARQLVYNDKRANPKGRVPDDTWILRPQDLPSSFTAEEDTWYVPRVCGTFKERQGFHGCQMPEQLLGRIVRSCTKDSDLVLDPFAGSGTTAAVAKKLGRSFLTFDLSPKYVEETARRIDRVRVGQPLEGSEPPTISATTIVNGHRQVGSSVRNGRASGSQSAELGNDSSHPVAQAFGMISGGYSSDRVLADPRLNSRFASTCRQLRIPGDPEHWNRKLLGLRKANLLHSSRATERTRLNPSILEQVEFASEISLGILRASTGATLDSILCNPDLADRFDNLAQLIWPIEDKNAVLYYRWAALGLRKRAKKSRVSGKAARNLVERRRFSPPVAIRKLRDRQVPDSPGAFLIQQSERLFIGTSKNLREWFGKCSDSNAFSTIRTEARRRGLALAFRRLPVTTLAERRSVQSYLIGSEPPQWNYPDLAIEVTTAA